MTEIRDAACHCGTVRFRATLADGLQSAGRCDCGFCAMRGAVTVTARLDGVEILAGREALTLYQFGTNTAEHWFCARGAASTPITAAARTRTSSA